MPELRAFLWAITMACWHVPVNNTVTLPAHVFSTYFLTVAQCHKPGSKSLIYMMHLIEMLLDLKGIIFDLVILGQTVVI